MLQYVTHANKQIKKMQYLVLLLLSIYQRRP